MKIRPHQEFRERHGYWPTSQDLENQVLANMYKAQAQQIVAQAQLDSIKSNPYLDTQRLQEEWLINLETGTNPLMRKTMRELKEKQEEKRKEEEHNMKVWGRKDDPRLDPTSEMFDPLKLVYKDSDGSPTK